MLLNFVLLQPSKQPMKNAALLFVLLWPICAHAQISKTMRRLPDTGQTQSFTNTPGEDADFNINPPFFIKNGDGTATDTVTGLMWQQTDGGEMTFEAAQTYAANLVLGGHSDWRLPTAQEAFSMLNHGQQNPPLDPAVFPNSGAEYWWTGETQVGAATRVWVTNAGGGIGNHPKAETISAGGTKKFHVRVVRDVAPPARVAAQFSTTTNTAFDSLTGLEWQRFVVPTIQDSMTWEAALVFAENFVLAGKSDWRLPNIKELESINDETRSQPSVYTAVFPGLGSKKFWASTSLPNQSTQAWFMDTRFGVVSHELKTLKNSVLLVRGGGGGIVSAAQASLETTGWSVYPNPFSDHIFLKNAPPDAVVELTNAVGRVFFFGKNVEQEDFSKLPAGMYFLKISEQNTAALRLIKK